MRIARSGSRAAQHYSRDILQNRNRLSPVSSESFPSQEIIMSSNPTRLFGSAFALAVASILATSLWTGAALASQGPGGGPGTAGSFTQIAMAIIVYGTSAAIVGAGLIGAARRSH
jgi:hypothetical protein